MSAALAAWLPRLAGLAALLLGGFWLWREAGRGQVIDPDRCDLEAVRTGRAECGGPCCTGRLPCQSDERRGPHGVTRLRLV